MWVDRVNLNYNLRVLILFSITTLSRYWGLQDRGSGISGFY